jgi:hypothetical protein
MMANVRIGARKLNVANGPFFTVQLKFSRLSQECPVPTRNLPFNALESQLLLRPATG